ncbi:hypothetical protein, partial [Kitasatospora sp. NPDC093558]|uniref:hypothetical protein n=1 Tax=Kitasatospora sp. NPDC093558 TaxID=3155201 RepID=UPI0034408283
MVVAVQRLVGALLGEFGAQPARGARRGAVLVRVAVGLEALGDPAPEPVGVRVSDEVQFAGADHEGGELLGLRLDFAARRGYGGRG